MLVDADPQASLTIGLGNPQPDKLPVTIASLLRKVLTDDPILPREGILHHPEGVDFMPADIQLSGMEVSLVNAMSRETYGNMITVFGTEIPHSVRAKETSAEGKR